MIEFSLSGVRHVIRCVGSTDRTENMRTLWIRGIGHASRLCDSCANSLALLFLAQLTLVDGPGNQPCCAIKAALLYCRAWRLARKAGRNRLGFAGQSHPGRGDRKYGYTWIRSRRLITITASTRQGQLCSRERIRYRLKTDM